MIHPSRAPADIPARGWRAGVQAGRRWLQAHAPARWPGRCAVCQDWPARALCETCVSRFASPRWRCSGCALALPSGVPVCGQCLQSPAPWQTCVAAVDYDWPWDGLIADFKFHGHSGLAGPLAGLMQAAPGMAELLASADLVTAMPLSRQRLAERGYNQSLLLARQLGATAPCAMLLLRLRETPPQRSLPRAERLHNLHGALVADPLQAPRLRGRHVLLVDDVMTSGASLQAATLALLEGGAARVSTAVLARTPAHAQD